MTDDVKAWIADQRRLIDAAEKKGERVAANAIRDVSAELRKFNRKLKGIEKKLATIEDDSFDVTHAERDSAMRKIPKAWEATQRAYGALLHAAGQLSLFG